MAPQPTDQQVDEFVRIHQYQLHRSFKSLLMLTNVLVETAAV